MNFGMFFPPLPFKIKRNMTESLSDVLLKDMINIAYWVVVHKISFD